MSMRVACRVSGSLIWLNGLGDEIPKVTMMELYKMADLSLATESFPLAAVAFSFLHLVE